MLILPAIDLIRGQCVRLLQGDYSRETIYSDDPVAVAKDFEDQGAEWLHVVDLDGAKGGQPCNLAAVERIAAATSLKIELGGGIRLEGDVLAAFDAGVTRVVLGSVLVKEPETAAHLLSYGERVVAGIDAREGRVATGGWLDTSSLNAVELARDLATKGAKRIIFTDIARDGMLTGPNIGLLCEVIAASRVPVIQSGGISEIRDLCALAELGAIAPEGVIVGKALYERRFTLKDAIQAIKPIVGSA